MRFDEDLDVLNHLGSLHRQFSTIPHNNHTPSLGESGSAEEHSVGVIIVMIQEQFSRAVALEARLRLLEP